MDIRPNSGGSTDSAFTLYVVLNRWIIFFVLAFHDFWPTRYIILVAYIIACVIIIILPRWFVVVITQHWLHNPHAYCCYYYNRFLTYRFLANKKPTRSHFRLVNSHIGNKRQHQSFWPTFIYRNPFPTVFGAKNAINYWTTTELNGPCFVWIFAPLSTIRIH